MNIIKDKAVRLLIPFIVFTLVALFCKLVFPGEVSRQISNPLQTLITSFLYPYNNPMREMWFIATLFWMFILLPLWEYTCKNKLYIHLTIIILLILHKFHPDVELFCIGRFFTFAIYFYLGLITCKSRILEQMDKKGYYIMLIIGVLIYISGRWIDSFMVACGGIVFSIGLSLIFDRYCPRIFYTFRDYTYQIFLIGIFSQMFIKIAYRYVDIPYFIAYLICILVGIYVPVIISKIIIQFKSKTLLVCIGLK